MQMEKQNPIKIKSADSGNDAGYTRCICIKERIVQWTHDMYGLMVLIGINDCRLDYICTSYHHYALKKENMEKTNLSIE